MSIDMDKACKLAGLERSDPSEGYDVWWLPGEGLQQSIAPTSSALPAFVVNLLVNRVWELFRLDWAVDSGHPDHCIVEFTNEPTGHGTTFTARGKRDEWIELTIKLACEILEAGNEDEPL